jgi:hypothetical protein
VLNEIELLVAGANREVISSGCGYLAWLHVVVAKQGGKMKNAIAIAVTLAGLFATFGCSPGKLSRGQAAKLLQQTVMGTYQIWSPSILTHIGKLSNRCKSYGTPGSAEKVLGQLGYMDIKDLGHGIREVSLTEKGKSAIKDSPYAHEKENDACEHSQVSLLLARRSNLQITGIAQEGIQAVADYNYTWELTALGEQLSKDKLDNLHLSKLDLLTLCDGCYDEMRLPFDPPLVHRDKAAFIRYDDGWKAK